MSTNRLNISIAIVGFILLLLGLTFHAYNYDVFSISLTGIGASVLATAIVNWVLNRRIDNMIINSIAEAISNRSQLIRTEQSLELVLSENNNKIELQKTHKFCFINKSNFPKNRNVSIFTDSILSYENEDGFISVIEPEGRELKDESLKQYILRKNAKVEFKKVFRLPPGKSNPFIFKSRHICRKKDRLVWTVQDFSTDFNVQIINNTGKKEKIEIKINHHKENEITESIQISSYQNNTEVTKFEIPFEILPFQGFEINWDFE